MNPALDPLKQIAGEGRDWLFDQAAPLWAPESYGWGQLFPERMSIDGVKERTPHRLFVQARHIFSYIQAGRMGWSGPWRDYAGQGIDTLLAKGRRADGFYFHKFALDGRAHDNRADLYDQAFLLFVFAHASMALDRPDLMEAAVALDDALDAHWRLPHGGYHEGEIATCPPYRQNPHMHLLESFLALEAASGDPRWRRKAEAMVKLGSDCFIDRDSGALTEYFDVSLKPLSGAQGRIVEPGHCFEWAWLYEMAAPWMGAEAIRHSDRLVAFARRYGIDRERGVAINEVTTDGAVHNAHARCWPQTERLKAALARYRRTRDISERDEAVAAFRGLTKYLDAPQRGAWRDKLKPDGSWVEEPAPGSSLYHITCALMELWTTAEAAG